MITWIIFIVAVVTALLIDLGLHSNKAKIPLSEAIKWSIIWILLALGFNIWIYFELGTELALRFLTAYVVEKSLSVDNLFVFLLIFKSFSIPPRLRHKVLFWGVVGAIILRGIFIAGGLILVSYFTFMFYIFGIFLILTAYKLAFNHNKELHPENNPIILWVKRIVPVDSSNKTDQFFTKKNNTWSITPLFLALIAVEITDVVFAIDSIPAVLGITTNPLIVYSSNIFAILGLRSLYFVLERSLDYFQYLHYALAAILCFIGIKMLLAQFWHPPIALSLGVIAGTLAISIMASFVKPKS